MDEKDRLLWTYLHNGLAWVRRPFEELAAKTGLNSAEVFVRIQRLKKEGFLRDIGPVWDSRRFHYQSAWGVLWVESPNTSLKLEGLLEHPGVFYVCERKELLNIWFFIAVPAEHDLELHVQCLGKMVDAVETWVLPVQKIYKGTNFLSAWDEKTFCPMGEYFLKRHRAKFENLMPEQIEMIRNLQDFSLTDEPYDRIAGNMGLSPEDFIENVKELVQQGYLRRMGTWGPPPPSQETKIKTLVAWQVPGEKVDFVGEEAAGLEEVLFAEHRAALPSFSYSFYTVLQTGKGHDFGAALRRVEGRIGNWPRKIMMTIREFKKTPVKYFPQGLDMWWDRHRAVIETAYERGGIPADRKHGASGPLD